MMLIYGKVKLSFGEFVASRRTEDLPGVSRLFLHRYGLLTDQKEASD